MCLYVFVRFERTYHNHFSGSLDTIQIQIFEMCWAQQWISSSSCSVATCWTRLQDFLLVSQLNRGQWRPALGSWALDLWWICQCHMITLALEGEVLEGCPFSTSMIVTHQSLTHSSHWLVEYSLLPKPIFRMMFEMPVDVVDSQTLMDETNSL